ncbi:MAG TPA: DinB family protein [Candidatus Limnocylindria bacterium]|nr:DinB family protein [Candidatus Limnocylindria bacterium]
MPQQHDRAAPGGHDQLNAQSRARLVELVDGLDERALRLPLGEHWTVAAGLLHLSFWDRFTLERWADAQRMRLTTPRPLADFTEDQINDTLTPLLLAATGEQARRQVLESAQAVDEFIARLPAQTVELVRTEGRPRLLDRSIHRVEHLDEIEALLAG